MNGLLQKILGPLLVAAVLGGVALQAQVYGQQGTMGHLEAEVASNGEKCDEDHDTIIKMHTDLDHIKDNQEVFKEEIKDLGEKIDKSQREILEAINGQ